MRSILLLKKSMLNKFVTGSTTPIYEIMRTPIDTQQLRIERPTPLSGITNGKYQPNIYTFYFITHFLLMSTPYAVTIV